MFTAWGCLYRALLLYQELLEGSEDKGIFVSYKKNDVFKQSAILPVSESSIDSSINLGTQNLYPFCLLPAKIKSIVFCT